MALGMRPTRYAGIGRRCAAAYSHAMPPTAETSGILRFTSRPTTRKKTACQLAAAPVLSCAAVHYIGNAEPLPTEKTTAYSLASEDIPRARIRNVPDVHPL